MILYYKVGDTRPDYAAVLLDANGEPLPNLDQATVSLRLIHSSEKTGKIKQATVLSAAEAKVAVVWEEGDFSKAGTYYAEFKVDYEDGSRLSVPNYERLEIRVMAEIPAS